MNRTSVFVFECECGAKVQANAPETQCPGCNRVLSVDWNSQTNPPKWVIAAAAAAARQA
jgi:hypothetical protein